MREQRHLRTSRSTSNGPGEIVRKSRTTDLRERMAGFVRDHSVEGVFAASGVVRYVPVIDGSYNFDSGSTNG